MQPEGNVATPALGLWPTSRRRTQHAWVPRLPAVMLGAALLIAVVLVALAGLRPYVPLGDHALLEMGVRRVLDGQPPEVGPFSRYGWFHPGPAIYYVLAPGYLLTGGASWSLPVTTFVVNITCFIVGIEIVRRQLGNVSAAWAALSLLILLRQLPDGLLRDPWNPFLALPPFCLAVLLCWAAANGSRRALPAAVVLLSFSLQSHIGYAVAVVAVALGVIVAALLTRRLAWPDRRTTALAVFAVGLMWLPPLHQQLVGNPGNVTAVLRDFGEPALHPSWSYSVRTVATELGRLPAYLLGQTGDPQYLAPDTLPVWLAVLALALFVSATAWSLRRHDQLLVSLATFTALLTIAAVVGVRQTRGLFFAYVVQWNVVPGILLWLMVGAWLIRLLPKARAAWATTALVAACLPVAALTIAGLVSSKPESQPGLVAVSRDIEMWRQQNPSISRVVTVEYMPTLSPTLVGVSGVGTGLLLQFDRAGIAFASPPGDLGLGPVVPQTASPATTTLLLGLDGNSPPPPAGFALVSRGAGLVVYAET